MTYTNVHIRYKAFYCSNIFTICEDDEPKTNGEDLRILFQEELEESSDDHFSWDRVDSSSE